MVKTYLVGPYARAIYLYGTKRFSDIPAEYEAPVEKYAAETFTKEEIDNALNQGWVTQDQYDKTIALIPPVVI